MFKIALQLQENLLRLNDQVTQFTVLQFEGKLKKRIEQLITKATTFFYEISEAIENLKWGKITDLILQLLSDIEKFLLDFYNRFSLPYEKELVANTKNIIAAIKQQVAFLDQKRQSYLVFE